MKMNFEVVDPQDKVAGVAKKWRAQYGHYPYGHRLFDGKTVGEIQQALDLLKPNATPKQVEKIIGNESWTKEMCCNCHEYFDKGVIFDNYDHKAAVCLSCLKLAVRKSSR